MRSEVTVTTGDGPNIETGVSSENKLNTGVKDMNKYMGSEMVRSRRKVGG